MNRSLIFILISFVWVSCQTTQNDLNSIEKDRKTFSTSSESNKSETKGEKTTQIGFISGYPGIDNEGNLQAVIEIPAGTVEKWEVNKTDESLDLEMIDGKPRIIQYLGYPGNYGMIPQTILNKENGGDGDPLDVLVIGPPAERGTVIDCQLIGVLKLLDGGEQDDKLIAMASNASLKNVDSLESLRLNYPGITEIIELWFSNYKGPGKMESLGFDSKERAQEILDDALMQYEILINQD